jgi:hypothetical protein
VGASLLACFRSASQAGGANGIQEAAGEFERFWRRLNSFSQLAATVNNSLDRVFRREGAEGDDDEASDADSDAGEWEEELADQFEVAVPEAALGGGAARQASGSAGLNGLLDSEVAALCKR